MARPMAAVSQRWFLSPAVSASFRPLAMEGMMSVRVWVNQNLVSPIATRLRGPRTGPVNPWIMNS